MIQSTAASSVTLPSSTTSNCLSHGEISRDEAEKLLRPESVLNGAWLLRYSPNAQNFVVSIKTNHVITHSIPTEQQALLDKLKDITKIVFPSSLTQKILPQFHLSLKEKAYHKFKELWLTKVDSSKLLFNDCTFSCVIGHNAKEMLWLRLMIPSLGLYIGGSERVNRNYHERYFPPTVVTDSSCHLTNDRETSTLFLEEAHRFLASFQPIKVDLTVPSNITEDEIFPTLLNGYRGVIVGEDHANPASRRLLIQHMAQLKALGVDTIYLEHFVHETTQENLDLYFRNPQKPMPVTLKLLLDGLSDRVSQETERSEYSYTDVVRAAIQSGIRVVALESPGSAWAGIYSWGIVASERLKGMNYQAYRCVNPKTSGKFVVLTGSLHCSYSQGIPGISELLGCPNVVFRISSKGLKTNVTNVEEPKQLYHILWNEHVVTS